VSYGIVPQKFDIGSGEVYARLRLDSHKLFMGVEATSSRPTAEAIAGIKLYLGAQLVFGPDWGTIDVVACTGAARVA